jgi:hypothetical protein
VNFLSKFAWKSTICRRLSRRIFICTEPIISPMMATPIISWRIETLGYRHRMTNSKLAVGPTATP